MDRRTFLRAGTLGLAAPALIAERSQAQTRSITVADPGGPFGEAFGKAFYRPFEQATGIRVVNVARPAEPTAQFRAMVETKSYTWDCCILTLSARDIMVKQNLLEPIGLKPEDAPGMMPEALTPFWMGTDVYATILAVRTDKLGGPAPESWADLWNVAKFPGRRSLRKDPIDTLEEALLADGVPLADLYPLDLDRAFRSLDKIKPHVAAWWTGGAQATQMLQSGEVAMIPTWNGRVQPVIDAGGPVKIVWNQGLYSIEGWSIPRGSPRADAARQFIRFCSEPARQAVYTEGLSYGPTNLKAYDTIPEARAKLLPTHPENLKLMRLANEEWWSANRAAAAERFNAWVLR
ncbi:ABC transporter substrate-binding protein [Belnapia sp. T6]|uniref:ABC transporter substrate-binding protein n=1 Tax=Belnapia mucosa TaxID=2804532 RepID=A0ABS1V5R2_9PROT|nr:ABC transporter substrate-binding protein [Belnapia mucosa]MBL6456034.1 ABC transporter substrate-binding protein [Belnapia mucosa]